MGWSLEEERRASKRRRARAVLGRPDPPAFDRPAGPRRERSNAGAWRAAHPALAPGGQRTALTSPANHCGRLQGKKQRAKRAVPRTPGVRRGGGGFGGPSRSLFQRRTRGNPTPSSLTRTVIRPPCPPTHSPPRPPSRPPDRAPGRRARRAFCTSSQSAPSTSAVAYLGRKTSPRCRSVAAAASRGAGHVQRALARGDRRSHRRARTRPPRQTAVRGRARSR